LIKKTSLFLDVFIKRVHESFGQRFHYKACRGTAKIPLKSSMDRQRRIVGSFEERLL